MLTGGIQKKVRAACESGVKEVPLPVDNLREAQGLPQCILDAIALTQVELIEESARADVDPGVIGNTKPTLPTSNGKQDGLQ